MEEFEFKADYNFYDTDYILEIRGDSESALIEVEQKSNGLIWCTEINEGFTNKLTKKVGNYK